MLTAARTLLFSFFLLLPAITAGASFEEDDVLGSKAQILLLPNYSGEKLIGINIYKVFMEGEIGTAFLTKESFYRLDPDKVIEDRDYYRVSGIHADGTLEIERVYNTQRWSVNAKTAASFDAISQSVAKNKNDIPELRKVYELFRYPPFKDKAGPEERNGERLLKWTHGHQKVDEVIFRLNKHPNFGNRFSAALIYN